MSFNSNEDNQGHASSEDLRFDKAALEELFKKYYPTLCAYCKVKYGFDLHLAEDVVHSSFIKLWEARHMLTSNNSIKSYLYKIVDNSSLNVLRHEKVKKQHTTFILNTTSEDVSALSFESIDLKQLRSAIDAAISNMPTQMRTIFELRKFQGLKYAEIASRLNISVKTVDTQMSRAMVRLKEHLSGFLLLLIIVTVSFFLKKYFFFL